VRAGDGIDGSNNNSAAAAAEASRLKEAGNRAFRAGRYQVT
jgi:hypothetical protein